MKKSRLDPIIMVSVCLFCLILVFINFPPIIGFWETSTIYFELEKFKDINYRDYKLLIQDGGNVAGQYGNHGYPLLRLFNPLLLLTGLPYTYFNIRFLPKLFGLLSLLFFGLLVKRKTDTKTASLSVLLLATNFVFFSFQNQLMPIILTFMAVIYTLTIFDGLYFNDHPSWKLIPLLGLGYAFLAIHYSMGRMLLIFLMIYQIADVVLLKLKYSSLDSTFIAISKLKIIIFSWGSFLFLLLAFHTQNLRKLFNKDFLFPVTAEVVEKGSEAIFTLIFNLKDYFTKAFFTTPTNYFSFNQLKFIEGTVDSLVSPLIFLPALIGLYFFYRNRKRNEFIFYLLIIAMFFCLPLMSLVMKIKGKPHGTMSLYRAFFNLFGCYFGFSFFIFYCSEMFRNSWRKYLFSILIIGLLAIEISALAVKVSATESALKSVQIDFSQPAEASYKGTVMSGNDTHVYAYKLAQKVAQELKSKDCILLIDQEKLESSYPMHILINENYMVRLFFIYLQNFGVNSIFWINDIGFRFLPGFEKDLVIVLDEYELYLARNTFKNKPVFTLAKDGEFRLSTQ